MFKKYIVEVEMHTKYPCTGLTMCTWSNLSEVGGNGSAGRGTESPGHSPGEMQRNEDLRQAKKKKKKKKKQKKKKKKKKKKKALRFGASSFSL